MRRSRRPAAAVGSALGRAALCSALALLLAGCAKPLPVSTAKGKSSRTAAAARAPKKKLPAAEGLCINPRAVSNFRVLDRTRILVNTYPQRVIEVYDSCDGVRFLEELTFAGTGGIICDYRSDALIVQGVRCPIASIKDYEADADAELRKEIEGATPDGAKTSRKKSGSASAPAEKQADPPKSE